MILIQKSTGLMYNMNNYPVKRIAKKEAELFKISKFNNNVTGVATGYIKFENINNPLELIDVPVFDITCYTGNMNKVYTVFALNDFLLVMHEDDIQVFYGADILRVEKYIPIYTNTINMYNKAGLIKLADNVIPNANEELMIELKKNMTALHWLDNKFLYNIINETYNNKLNLSYVTEKQLRFTILS